MSDSEGDQNWTIDLESALIEGCDSSQIKSICANRPFPGHLRAEIWPILLSSVSASSHLDSFSQLFDLKEQDLIRKDCQTLVDKLGNDEEEKVSVASDLESIITCYCKAHKCPYSGGWMEILQPMLALHMNSNDLYNCFTAILSKYIARDCHRNGEAFNILRLLLLYHEPELCSFLDTKRVTPDIYSITWLSSLMASVCDLKVTLNLWDVYFQYDDPFLVFFLALVILINAKEQLIPMADCAKQDISDLLQSIPAALGADDIEDFCSLAQYYNSKTPETIKKTYRSVLFTDDSRVDIVPEGLCLSVTAEELLSSIENPTAETLKFFVVDCRPADQYNSGHLMTAFYLDANLMLQNPTEFATAVQALVLTKSQTNVGEHLCFVGSGREEEDQYVHMVVAHFLQRGSQYVSVLQGGYQALHSTAKDNLQGVLVDHKASTCLACNPGDPGVGPENERGANGHSVTADESLVTRFGKLGSAVKNKSAGLKDMMVNYIRNEGGPHERHVNSSDKGRRYRGMASVFSIGDEDEEAHSVSSSEDEHKDVVNVDTWLKKADVLQSFECQELRETGYMYKSYLLLTLSHLFVLREIPHRQGLAWVQGRRALSSIVKITSKKRHPELITFKYGVHCPGGAGIQVNSLDRFLIPRAGEATKAIKTQIIKILDALETKSQ